MSKVKQTGLVPRLRFPEFQDATPWVAAIFGDVTTLTGERNKKGTILPIYSINNVSGFLPQSEQFEGVDSNDRGYDTTLYKIVRSNTFAYNPARIDVGSIGYSADLDNVLVSSLYICFKTKKGMIDLFLWQFLQTDMFKEEVRNNVEGGIRRYLFYPNLARINIPCPLPREQQKVADCLSSIDDLIKAETEKLTALKEYKKGLLQRLFPAVGDAEPTLRFPEFRGAREWVSKSVLEIFHFIPTNTFSRDQLNYDSGAIRNIHYGDIHKTFHSHFELGNESVPYINLGVPTTRIGASNYCIEGDLVFADASEDLLDVGKCIEIISNGGQKIVAGLHTIHARPKSKELHIGFAAYLFQSENARSTIRNESQGTKVYGISIGRLGKVQIWFPANKKEQKLITDCLEEADRLIIECSKFLEVVKQHKGGLLQCLFISPKSNSK
jgi:type I restriction enzyme S subunit